MANLDEKAVAPITGASRGVGERLSHETAAEPANSGVTVTAVCPGPADAGFRARAETTDTHAGGTTPVSTAEDVAAAVRTGFRTGRKIVVSGIADAVPARSAKFSPRGVTTPIMRPMSIPGNM